jgi:D-alanyl-D-alanine dipeptidase
VYVADTDLVNLTSFDTSLRIALQYKEAHNFAGRPLYHRDFPALLHINTAKRLKKANHLLGKNNLRLVIWDAYRPHETQLALWDACGHDDRYVANPMRQPSLHSHGCAVDVSLEHLDGTPAAVPTKFDEFSPLAASDHHHPDPVVRENMRQLKEAMWAAGFGTLPHEWWHFMDKDYRQLPFIATDTLPAALQTMIHSPLP